MQQISFTAPLLYHFAHHWGLCTDLYGFRPKHVRDGVQQSDEGDQGLFGSAPQVSQRETQRFRQTTQFDSNQVLQGRAQIGQGLIETVDKFRQRQVATEVLEQKSVHLPYSPCIDLSKAHDIKAHCTR